jgi:hypothetical protein
MLFDYKAESRPRSCAWVIFWKFFNHWLAKHHALVVISIVARHINKDVLLGVVQKNCFKLEFSTRSKHNIYFFEFFGERDKRLL